MATKEHYHVKKEVVLVVVALVLGLVLGFLFARNKYKGQLMKTNDLVIGRDAEIKEMASKLNRVMMWGNSVLLMKDGVMEAMREESMMLRDGTKVMRNGDYLKSNGEKGRLQNGSSFDMDGNMMKAY